MQNTRGEVVVRILRELVLGEGSAHLVDGRRAADEQEDATNDFEDAVEALEDDCDREGSVEPVTALEPVHRVKTWRGRGDKRRHCRSGVPLTARASRGHHWVEPCYRRSRARPNRSCRLCRLRSRPAT